MQTTALYRTDSEAIVSIVDRFNTAWNERDLSKISNLLAQDVVYSNPPAKLSFINIPGKEVFGLFKVLQFYKSIFERFNATQEEKFITNVEHENNKTIVSCNVHNHGLKISSKLTLHLNNELYITKIKFTKVTRYKGEKELSAVSLLLKQFKARYLKN